MLPAGAGLTFHPALVPSILRSPPAFLEFVAEGLTTTAQRKQARALAEVAPLSVHGTGLSLGSADGLDDARARALGDAAAAVSAVAVSEHLAFVRAAGHEIGHLTPLPFTRAAVDVVCRNVDRARRWLPDLWLENVWSPLPARRLPDELDEPEFLCAIVERTGCGLLLDVANLVANAHNRGCAPLQWLDRLPLFAVRQLHIAGSADDADGFVVDTHADPVKDDVFAFAAAVLARTGPLPVCLERDRDVVVGEVEADVARAAALVAAAPPRASSFSSSSSRPSAPSLPSSAASAALAQWQAQLAADLVADAVDDDDLARARSILARKRAEKRAHARPPPRPSSSVSSFFSSLWGML